MATVASFGELEAQTQDDGKVRPRRHRCILRYFPRKANIATRGSGFKYRHHLVEEVGVDACRSDAGTMCLRCAHASPPPVRQANAKGVPYPTDACPLLFSSCAHNTVHALQLTIKVQDFLILVYAKERGVDPPLNVRDWATQEGLEENECESKWVPRIQNT